jgi:hypothetical protein
MVDYRYRPYRGGKGDGRTAKDENPELQHMSWTMSKIIARKREAGKVIDRRRTEKPVQILLRSNKCLQN